MNRENKGLIQKLKDTAIIGVTSAGILFLDSKETYARGYSALENDLPLGPLAITVTGIGLIGFSKIIPKERYFWKAGSFGLGVTTSLLGCTILIYEFLKNRSY